MWNRWSVVQTFFLYSGNVIFCCCCLKTPRDLPSIGSSFVENAAITEWLHCFRSSCPGRLCDRPWVAGSAMACGTGFSTQRWMAFFVQSTALRWFSSKLFFFFVYVRVLKGCILRWSIVFSNFSKRTWEPCAAQRNFDTVRFIFEFFVRCTAQVISTATEYSSGFSE